jgi:hypothetical protein
MLVAVPPGAEPEVRADDDQAGQHRRQRGRGEPAVRLQDAVQHHGQAVEQDLRREHDQHPGAHGDHGGARAPGARRAAPRRAAARRSRPGADRDEQQHRPGQQRGGDLPHLLAVPADQPPGSAGPASTGTTDGRQRAAATMS